MNSYPVQARQRGVQPAPARPLRGRPRRGLPLQQARRPPRLRPLEEPHARSSTGSARTGGSPTRASGRCAGGRRQFVSSKLLSWVALERAGRIARQRGLPAGERTLEAERDAIYEEIMEKGWNHEKNSFVQYYGSDALDASLLLMPLVKFVGPTDPRWIATLRPHPGGADLRHPRRPLQDGRSGPRRPCRERGQLQPVLFLARGVPDAGRTPRRGATGAGENVLLRQPPRALRRGDRALRRGAWQLPPGFHPPGPDQRRRPPRPRPWSRADPPCPHRSSKPSRIFPKERTTRRLRASQNRCAPSPASACSVSTPTQTTTAAS